MKTLIVLCSMVWATVCQAQVNNVQTLFVAASGAITLDTGHALAANMVACYILEDSVTTGTGSAIKDLTSNGYDLTITDGTRQTHGIYFDGVDDIAVGTHTPITTEPFTLVIVMEVNDDSGSSPGLQIAKSTVGAEYANLEMRLDTTMKPRMTTRGTGFYSVTGDTIALNTKTVFAGVYTSNISRELFVDGVSKGSSTDDSAIISTMDKICLGATCDSTPLWGEDKIIYAAYIYDDVLSSAQAISITNDPYQMINNWSGP